MEPANGEFLSQSEVAVPPSEDNVEVDPKTLDERTLILRTYKRMLHVVFRVNRLDEEVKSLLAWTRRIRGAPHEPASRAGGGGRARLERFFAVAVALSYLAVAALSAVAWPSVRALLLGGH